MVEDLENVLDILLRPDNFQLKKIQPDSNVKTKETLDDNTIQTRSSSWSGQFGTGSSFLGFKIKMFVECFRIFQLNHFGE